MNLLLDNNIVIDILSEERQKKFEFSKVIYNDLINKSGDNKFFISASSIDNLEFILFRELKVSTFLGKSTSKEILKIVHLAIQDLLKKVSIAKTPAYMEIDYDDVEDSQIIASAQAVSAKVITRDKEMIAKYPDTAISPQEYRRLSADKNIDFANLKKQYFDLQPQIEKQMDEVLNTTSFIMGDKVRELEAKLEEFTGAKHAITCSSGTDALILSMMAMGIQPGDEVITTPFTFIATAETIALMKAVPVFVDIEEETFNIDATKIEAAITDRTKAIMPVSLYGQPADMDEIQGIANKHNLKIIIDGAQSFGATYKGKTDSNLGDISTTSFFPAKPLGCYGDGGAVFTNNDDYAKKMKMMRVHGQNKRYHHKYIGMGGRLDTIQAAVLLAKLSNYQGEIIKRQQVAERYNQLFSKNVIIPAIKANRSSVWAQYTIRVEDREVVQNKLKEKGVPTAVHYPMPLHMQECFNYLNTTGGSLPIAEISAQQVISLPLNPDLSSKDQDRIIDAVLYSINK